ncbi:hypothetical protein [Pseudolysinimonas sp.]|uniref:hypothetical protein n=1 Tax=Pseudolysinimonas sp. TaxID=2680009 RepID=UPI00378428D2
MIRIVLAGSSAATRADVAAALAERLGLPSGDGFVLADPPADPVAFDASLARVGAEVDALLHLGGAPDALLEHYGRAVVECASTEVDGILAALREALTTAAR